MEWARQFFPVQAQVEELCLKLQEGSRQVSRLARWHPIHSSFGGELRALWRRIPNQRVESRAPVWRALVEPEILLLVPGLGWALFPAMLWVWEWRLVPEQVSVLAQASPLAQAEGPVLKLLPALEQVARFWEAGRAVRLAQAFGVEARA